MIPGCKVWMNLTNYLWFLGSKEMEWNWFELFLFQIGENVKLD